MFNSGKRNDAAGADRIDTMIGENTTLQGTLQTVDTTRIDGTLIGEIQSKAAVIIGKTGKVEGDVSAVNVLVAGTVHGNLNVSERTEITDTGRINGDIHTKTLIIDEGASFKGGCVMEVQQSRQDAEQAGESVVSTPVKGQHAASKAKKPDAVEVPS